MHDRASLRPHIRLQRFIDERFQLQDVGFHHFALFRNKQRGVFRLADLELQSVFQTGRFRLNNEMIVGLSGAQGIAENIGNIFP